MTKEQKQRQDQARKLVYEEIEPYEDAVSDVPLIADEPFGSKVIAEKKIEKIAKDQQPDKNSGK